MEEMTKTYDKIIIAGFPGVGKSYCAEVIAPIVRDCESSDFHWIVAGNNNNKVQHPEWPANYIKYVKMLAFETEGLEDYKDLLYVLISTHDTTLSILREQKIPFIIVVPESKDDAISRYRARGSSEAFIQNVDEHWDEWMEGLTKYDMPIVRLAPGMYLSDYLDPVSTYDLLKSKINDVENYVLSLERVEEESDS